MCSTDKTKTRKFTRVSLWAGYLSGTHYLALLAKPRFPSVCGTRVRPGENVGNCFRRHRQQDPVCADSNPVPMRRLPFPRGQRRPGHIRRLSRILGPWAGPSLCVDGDETNTGTNKPPMKQTLCVSGLVRKHGQEIQGRLCIQPKRKLTFVTSCVSRLLFVGYLTS